MRKYCVVPTVSRSAAQDIDVGPHRIPRGTTIFIGIQGVHHNPRFWPNPSKFDPTRFSQLNSSSGNKQTANGENKNNGLSTTAEILPYTFIPFIEGPRNCLGQYLALLESKIVLAMLFQRYTLTLNILTGDSERGNNDDPDPRHRYMVPVTPKNPIRVSVQKNF